jgi:translation initiation factor 3 subunit F
MTSLILSETDTPKVSVHPLVVLTVLDAYMRRGTGLNRVIGTLLGTKTANLIEVTSCYCVPHQETAEGEIAFDEDYNTKMLSLKKAMAQGEEIVGWFATTAENGQTVDYLTCFIHDYYGRLLDDTSIVHLVVDTACTDKKVAVTAYTGTALALGEETLASQFKAVPVTMTATATEKTACDVMVKSVVRGDETKEGSSNKLDDLDSLESSITRLLEMLDTNCDYVESVLAGRTPKDDSVGKEIFQALAAVPRMDPDVFGKMFNDRLQDMLMVVYLSNLTRTQLSIADKIAQCDDLVA